MSKLMFLFSLLVCHCVLAQQGDTHVSGEYNGATVEQFVRDLEKKTSYRFYYDSTQLSAVRITVSFRDVALQAALEAAFKNSTIYFSVDNHHRVFLTSNFKIATRLLLPAEASDTVGIAGLKNL